ncbi:metallophosphoesterase [Psychroserpens algicola]|uniref:Metallophosphoesterase n=1 Tax=Psychroserpens algicola TaxID=1719034 RepID=A0ABT0H8M7_9FLAO|nr:metallophosphoesterase [Psychroserpens algicola]MCK8480724.1 metallophosphoesterase [Psychroserpens algicola]
MKSFYLFGLCMFCLISFNCKEGNESNAIVNTFDETVAVDSVNPSISSSTFLALSDVHLESGVGNVTFGRHNDTGDSLWARTKRKIEAVIKAEQPKFMVYLGDLPHHEDTSRVKNVTLMLEHLRALNINIPLLYLPGNNDSLAGDYYSFQDSEGKTPFSVDDSAADPWPILHDKSGVAKISNTDFQKQFGYYATDISVGTDTLKIIALNSVIMTRSYYFDKDDVSQQAAAQKQFIWLEKTLDSIKTNKPILMMMHIPPGIDNYANFDSTLPNNCDNVPGPMWNSSYRITNLKGDVLSFQNAFLNLVAGKKDQIKGILTSHTHFDGIRRLYSSKKVDSDSLIGISMSTPGITIGHGNNPGFKLYEYNDKTFDILDFKTHYAIPTAHNYGTFKFIGDSSYTFKETYKISDSNLSILESIAKMNDTDLKHYMSEILAVKSHKTSGIIKCYEFDDVMNVLKD